MFEYKIKQSDLGKLNEELDDNPLVKDLRAVEKKYGFDYETDQSQNDPNPVFQKVDYTPKSESELSEMAKGSLSSYKDKAIKAINSSYQNGVEKIADDENDATQEQEVRLANLKSQLESGLEGVNAKMLRQNIARSSIASEKTKQLQNQAQNQAQNITEETRSQLLQLSSEKSKLEAEKQSALESFNIEYAVKLEDKLTALKQKEQSLALEAVKTNNSVEKSLANIQNATAEQNIKEQNSYYTWRENYLDLLSKYGQDGMKKMEQKEKLETSKRYFAPMQKQDAIDDLITNEATYRSILGDDNFDILTEFVIDR